MEFEKWRPQFQPSSAGTAGLLSPAANKALEAYPFSSKKNKISLAHI